MDNFDNYLEQRANTDVLIRAYDCTHCKATETVVEECSNGVEFGQCTECKTKYLPPDWDAMEKEF